MIYGSVCSGIEAATVAWHPLGWKPSFFSEIEAAPRSVLAHHYPDVPLHGDFTTIGANEYEPIDLLVGGTPCQSFSIAGLRGGLDDDRGNLALEFLRLAQRTRPKWLVWENVPGVLSSNGGLDFASLLRGMGECGYGFAYRVLDAQYFGVAQRRRRVFVVGYLGDWRRAAAVLFERHSLQGHSAPSRKEGKGTSDYAERRTGSGKQTFGTLTAMQGQKLWLGNQEALSGDYHIICPPISPCLETQKGGLRQPDVQAYVGAIPASLGKGLGHNKDEFIVPVSYSIMPMNSGKDYKARQTDVAQPLMAGGPVGGNQGGDFIAHQTVRRLTPRECERLQGFPDDYTLVPHRNKPMSDGPRYKALGNSMAVPVMRWIGERIQMVQKLRDESE